jgi:Family of unknown function (DUF5995)
MQSDAAALGSPVGSFAELLDRMTAIDQTLPASDGVACFNRMYRLVIESVQAHVAAGFFGDPAWMGRLDIVFANLYLSAAASPGSPTADTPRSWAALIDRRSDQRVTPLQFALAGMNAHINHDLPIAVVTTSDELSTSPDAGAHHADFERVNSILATAEPVIRKLFSDALLNVVDRTAPGLQDVVANFSIVKARETAWANAETLWALKQVSSALEADFLEGLDHLVGFASRGLLVPLRPDSHADL